MPTPGTPASVSTGGTYVALQSANPVLWEGGAIMENQFRYLTKVIGEREANKARAEAEKNKEIGDMWLKLDLKPSQVDGVFKQQYLDFANSKIQQAGKLLARYKEVGDISYLSEINHIKGELSTIPELLTKAGNGYTAYVNALNNRKELSKSLNASQISFFDGINKGQIIFGEDPITKKGIFITAGKEVEKDANGNPIYNEVDDGTGNKIKEPKYKQSIEKKDLGDMGYIFNQNTLLREKTEYDKNWDDAVKSRFFVNKKEDGSSYSKSSKEYINKKELENYVNALSNDAIEEFAKDNGFMELSASFNDDARKSLLPKVYENIASRISLERSSETDNAQKLLDQNTLANGRESRANSAQSRKLAKGRYNKEMEETNIPTTIAPAYMGGAKGVNGNIKWLDTGKIPIYDNEYNQVGVGSDGNMYVKERESTGGVNLRRLEANEQVEAVGNINKTWKQNFGNTDDFINKYYPTKYND